MDAKNIHVGSRYVVVGEAEDDSGVVEAMEIGETRILFQIVDGLRKFRTYAFCRNGIFSASFASPFVEALQPCQHDIDCGVIKLSFDELMGG